MELGNTVILYYRSRPDTDSTWRLSQGMGSRAIEGQNVQLQEP